MAQPPNVTIPNQDVAAQAIHAIRGYAYQLYATALAWARLSPGGTLHIECGNDYLEVAAQALTGVEVKDITSGSATLRSPGVVALLDRYWRLRAANAGHQVRMVYLSTQTLGRETGLIFPGSVPGLTYWRHAASEGVDLEPIRAALRVLDLSPALKAWVNTASHDDLREGLLRPIRFECGQPTLPDLADIVADALVLVGETLRLPPSDARRAVPVVLLRLLTLAATDGDRAVTATELRELLETAGTSRVPNSLLEQMAAAGEGGGASSDIRAPEIAVPLADMPTDDLVVDRSQLIDAQSAELAKAGFLWLTGASGLGKSGLAFQIAGRSNRLWHVVELDGEGAAVADRLCQAQRLTRDPAFGGLILDDLPPGLDRRAQAALRRLAAAARLADGALIVTAYHPPPPTLASQLALPDPASVEAPYFTEEEVGVFIAAEGGNPGFWERATYIFCNSGFPQLVAARIRGLKARGWPEDAIAEGTPFSDAPAEDVEAERADIRARLIRDLPDGAGTMLYRASVSTVLDRQMALALAEVEPAIAAGGAALDLLLGPWIERRAGARMRVSPLVADIGAKVLSPAEVVRVHQAISRDLSMRRPLVGSLLGQLFVSALLSKDAEGLNAVAGVVIMADADTKAALSDVLFVLQLVRLDAHIFPDDLALSRLLRLAQVKICARADDTRRALPAFRRLMVEIVGDPKETSLRMSGVSALLGPADIGFGPEDWFPIVRSLEGLPNLTESQWSGSATPVPTGNPAQFMFLWRATQMRAIADLETLVGLLDAAGPDIRRMYFDGLEDPYAGKRSMIQGPWVGESASADFDARDAARRYEDLQQVMETWGERSLAVECTCSRTVLLAEYARDLPAAVAVLNAAGPTLAGDPRIRRERAKLQSAMGEHALARETLAGLLDEVSPVDRVEHIHVLRDLAVSASHEGDLASAVLQFGEAAEEAAAGARMLRSLAAGLYADQAAAKVLLGDFAGAAETLMRAGPLVDDLDPEDPADQFRLRCVHGAAAWSNRAMFNSEARVWPSPGACSQPAPNQPIPGVKAYPLTFWYSMAMFEREVGRDFGAVRALAERSQTQCIEYFAGLELREAVFQAMKVGDVQAFLALVTEFCQYGEERSRRTTDTPTSMARLLPARPWKHTVLDLEHAAQLFNGRSSVQAFGVVSAMEGRPEDIAALAAALEADHELAALGRFLSAETFSVEALTDAERGLWPSLPVIWGQDLPDPDYLYLAGFWLWNWVRNMAFRDNLEAVVARAIAAQWRRRLETGSFALRNPSANGPAILAATDAAVDANSLAALLVATLPAVKIQLPVAFEAALRSAIADKARPEAPDPGQRSA